MRKFQERMNSYLTLALAFLLDIFIEMTYNNHTVELCSAFHVLLLKAEADRLVLVT